MSVELQDKCDEPGDTLTEQNQLRHDRYIGLLTILIFLAVLSLIIWLASLAGGSGDVDTLPYLM